MFTGLVEHMARMRSLASAPHGATLALEAGAWPPNPVLGESLCVNGCCLTLARVEPGALGFDIVPQTLALTTLGELRPGDAVNLERALRADSTLGGHMVSGHVDAPAAVLRVDRGGGQWRVRIEAPPAIAPLLHERGSVAVDGVSLTIAARGDGWFEVALIPQTLERTTLRDRMAGSRVNLEADAMARMVAAEVRRQLEHIGAAPRGGV
jgi:riboflavin synthase alpha subunit